MGGAPHGRRRIEGCHDVRALVTGGGGFLGRRIVELLAERGDEVRFLARGEHPDAERCGARGLRGDLRDATAVRRAVDGVDVVFHVAAKAGVWGPPREYRGINVDGTHNVLAAMRAAGVPRLIFTSTPSVVGYAADVEKGPRDLPHARRHESHYPATKAEAERMVCAANGPGLAAVALRPHLIIGPGDNNLMPQVVRRAAAGALPVVGDGRNRVDLTYIDNAAWAHLDAADALRDHRSAPAGKAYFISNDEPVVLWEWLGRVFAELGIRPPQRRVSLRTARAVGGLLEAAWSILPLSGEPRMTRFLAAALARSHWYDMEPARRDLGYRVRVNMDEATRRTVAWLKTETTR